jgi:hypothetical protein
MVKTAPLMTLLVFCFSSPLFAQVYKWVDDAGKTHFTDLIDNVPEKYRSQLDKQRLPEPSTVEPEEKLSEKAEGPAGEKPQEPKAEDEKPAGPSTEEIAAAEEAIGFLTNSIAQYAAYEEAIPNFPTTRQINDLFVSTRPGKEALAKKLEVLEMPVLKETAGFLRSSLEADKEFRAIGPNLPFLTRQTTARLKNERTTKQALIEKLQSALNAPGPARP